jgi:hypothetical protein
MANQEHLDLLRQGELKGADVINDWRDEHAGVDLDLSFADLSGINLRNADLGFTNFKGANLSSAQYGYALLNEADLTNTDLRRADFTRTDLSDAKLVGADLQDASLGMTDLSRADLREANLRNADLGLANLSDADLNGANFSRAKVGLTIFGNVDLRLVKELEDVNHVGPSTVGIDTIIRSQGNIPEVFLQGAGIPDTWITYARSLIGQPIDFYSCFISYSSRDEAFARRLHADLQSRGVRCWFAPEDLKIGDKIRPRIDESIRLYDKLLLVLSEYSVSSQWVEQEVETALEKERKDNRTVLFPIRLDKAVMDIEGGWPALIRNTRNIGDFTRWKRHDAYQKSLDRLLRDLKAEA